MASKRNKRGKKKTDIMMLESVMTDSFGPDGIDEVDDAEIWGMDMTEDSIRKITLEIQRLCNEPEKFVSGRDRERFKSYADKWKEKKSISEVWNDTEARFFPLFYPDEVITKLRKLLPNHFDVFQKLVWNISTPYVLRDFLMLEINRDAGWNTVLKLFENAPDTNSVEDLFGDEIKSFIAPVALDVLVWHILYRGNSLSEEINAETLSSDRIKQLTASLKARGDGFYLAYHYFKHLLRKESKAGLFYELLDVLEQEFHDKANELMVKDGELIVEGLDSISASEVSAFRSTGLLKASVQDDLLINFRVAIRMIGFDEWAEKAWDVFKEIYSHNAQGFFTYGVKFQLKHYDIALLLLCQNDMQSAWKEVQAFSRAGLHRLSNQYYDDKSSNLRYHIKFMWAVNLRMMDYFCREDDESAQAMWSEFWSDGLEYFRRFSKFQDDDPYHYLSVLLCYYYICFIKRKALENDTNTDSAVIKTLMPYFHEIDNMPVLVLMAAQLLMNNGIAWNDFMTGENAEFFNEEFCRALIWSKEQKKYEWVGRYLKKKKFQGTRA